ncbi:MAG TPA: helix-turn-helix domain-containing protein [Candidatus Binataceae bacterium]|nr:helix-turn-helix domain-containing protein [Candidatus Binataceae bacterium]
MADEKPGSSSASGAVSATSAESGATLGRFISDARKQRGLSADDVTNQTRIPARYIKMIESDSYSLISDQLYLLPFLRRYAAFLGLDAEDVATRFIRDVQHAETNVVRISEPIAMVAHKSNRWRYVALGVLIAVLAVLLADLAWRRIVPLRNVLAPAPAASAPELTPSPQTTPAPEMMSSPGTMPPPSAGDKSPGP